MGRGHGAGPQRLTVLPRIKISLSISRLPRCSRAIPRTNTRREKKKKKEGSCCVSRRIAEACSSWQVISAFGSTLLTLIMQLNAALRIPAAAHPHYNTVLPLSPTLSVTHTHTNQSVSPPPTPFHDHNLKHPRLKTAFFVSLQATPLQRHDCGNAFVFSRESARLDVHAASHRAEKNTST